MYLSLPTIVGFMGMDHYTTNDTMSIHLAIVRQTHSFKMKISKYADFTRSDFNFIFSQLQFIIITELVVYV